MNFAKFLRTLFYRTAAVAVSARENHTVGHSNKDQNLGAFKSALFSSNTEYGKTVRNV